MGIICPLIEVRLGAVHKLCRLKGEGGQKLPILLSKKTTKRGGGGGGKKSPFLRRNSLWTAPKVCVKIVTTWD